MSDSKSRPRRSRGSIFFPLLLVIIGVVILLVNLGVLTGDIWNVLVQLWPILLIVLGLDSIYKREGLVGPTFLIGLGVVFLMGNLGYLNVNTWQLVLTLWPILLIAIGFDILVGRRSLWLSLLGMVVIILILFGSLWLFGASISVGGAVTGEQIQQSLDGANRAIVKIEAGAGELQLGAMNQEGILLTGRIPDFAGNEVRSSYMVEGGVGAYRLREAGGQFLLPSRSAQKWVWDLDVTNTVPVQLELAMGAGKIEADLRDMELESVNIALAVGETRVVLPERGRLNATIKGAIGQIVIIVPRGVGVEIRADKGLANLSTPPNYTRVGDTYRSPGFASAENQVEIDLSMAIGNISIQEE